MTIVIVLWRGGGAATGTRRHGRGDRYHHEQYPELSVKNRKIQTLSYKLAYINP